MKNGDTSPDGHVMTSVDIEIGRFDENSLNPYFGLQSPGTQWPEGRSFARTANVHAMARLTEVLCGLSQYVSGDNSASDASLRGNIPIKERAEALYSIAHVIKVVIDLCPTILSEKPVSVDSDWCINPYEMDERLPSQIKRAADLAERF
jgi:hypothetical protein